MIGKLFKTGGARRGYWLVLNVTETGACPCLGLDEDMNIVSASSYQKHYVERKETVAIIPLDEIKLKPKDKICLHMETTVETLTGDTVCLDCYETMNP